ncbi:MAG: proton-conducting transporter membrane subunit [candidate division FCPU426 bacterium]
MLDWLPLFILIPLGTAFLLPLVGRWWRLLPDLLGNAALLALALMAVRCLGRSGFVQLGAWPVPLGIELRLDGLTALLLLIINGVGMAIAMYSTAYMRQYTSKLRYYTLFLCMIAGMNGVVLANDLFTLYIFVELSSIASYALVAFGGDQEQLEASFKYLIQGSLATLLILLGIGLLYALTGSLHLGQIAVKLRSLPAGQPVLFALALFISGLAVKSAIVPFHAWLPDAHPAAPAPISAMLSGVLIKAIGVYVLARLIFNVFGPAPRLLLIFQGLAVLSMVVGVLLAIGQWDMKRLFAYHSISQIGYVVLGLSLGTPLGAVGALYHLLNHSLFKSLLFLNAGAVEYSTGTRDLHELGGLHRALPVTARTSLIASLSIAGIPPFNGFWSKLIIILACVESGHYWLGTWAIAVSILTLASFLKVQRYAFFGGPQGKGADAPPARTPWLMGAAMVLLALACIASALAVIPGLAQPWLIEPAAAALQKGFWVP